MSKTTSVKMQKIIIAALVGIGLIFFITRYDGGAEEAPVETPTPDVTILALGNTLDTGPNGMLLELTGEIQAAADVDIMPEATGVIRGVYLNEGAAVSRGQTILELENADQQIALETARAQLASQQIALQELIDNSITNNDSTIAEVIEQQDVAIENAYRALLNNDLRSYPDDPTTTRYSGPTITGTYSSLEEGSYIIETYKSGESSGASFNFSGLESGTQAVTLDQPVPLGTRGLFVQFVNFPSNEVINGKWVVQIPNTRSPSYTSVQSNYESTVEGKDVTIKQSEVTEEDVDRQRSVVRQQELAVRSAEIALAKTIVRSPINGTITALDLDAGDFVSGGVSVASVKSLDDLEIVAYVTEFDRLFIVEGGTASIQDLIEGEVLSVGNSVDAATQKVKVRIAVKPESLGIFNTLFTEGQSVPVTLTRTANQSIRQIEQFENFHVIPLTAIQVIGTDTHVFSYDAGANTVSKIPVETGALLGDSILITDGLTDVPAIVEDARGLSDGDTVVLAGRDLTETSTDTPTTFE